MEKLSTPKRFLKNLGVFGFDEVEPLILAALVSEDPILLIGKAGTGKTFLLNSISEAMQLQHRHYNASLISFDDLIGFPYPSADAKSIVFIPTPATVWEAESVLIDELSRCKHETQNKFFSVIHERKIQGLSLDKLRFRWAAMNPFQFAGNENDQYEGCQPLDQALADRFGFVIEVPDWPDLSQDEQNAVIHPAGEAAISDDQGTLLEFVNEKRPLFLKALENPLPEVVIYSRVVTGLMSKAGFRFSPRRARLLARNITALLCVTADSHNDIIYKQKEKLFKLALSWSVPHRAYRDAVPGHIIDAVHAEAKLIAFTENESERWISDFLHTKSISKKIRSLFDLNIKKDTKSLAVIQLLARESEERKAIFCFVSFPALDERNVLNEEALNEMIKITGKIIEVDGELKWDESIQSPANSPHPKWAECRQLIDKLMQTDKLRAMRAKQLFLYLLMIKKSVSDLTILESELNNCFLSMKEILKQLPVTHEK